MCFYYKFKALCKERKIAETRALIEAGLSKSLVSKWAEKPDTNPNGETLLKLCNYFRVPADYFLNGEKENQPTISGDDELTKYIEMLRTRPEMRLLLDTQDGATKEQVEENVRFLDALRQAKNAD